MIDTGVMRKGEEKKNNWPIYTNIHTKVKRAMFKIIVALVSISGQMGLTVFTMSFFLWLF